MIISNIILLNYNRIKRFDNLRYDENFDYFASHTEWYEFVLNIGYIPTDLATTEATIAMLEYDSYTFGKKHWLYKKRNISEKVKFLIEKEYSKKELVLIALAEKGFDKITELFDCEKKLLRLKQESEKLTDWPECNES